jgi:hypothetical protein
MAITPVIATLFRRRGAVTTPYNGVSFDRYYMLPAPETHLANPKGRGKMETAGCIFLKEQVNL